MDGSDVLVGLLCVGWAVVIGAMLRRRYYAARYERARGLDYAPAHVPALAVPIAYAWYQVEPLLSHLLLLRDLRRSERIRRFLLRAEHLWMRQKSLNRRLTRRTD